MSSRPGLCVLASVACACVAVACRAEDDALAILGLRGDWAIDCTRPPGMMNPHETYSTDADGRWQVALAYDTEHAPIVSDIQSPRFVPPNRLHYTSRSQRPGSLRFTVVQEVGAGRKRTLQSLSDDGTAWIMDGQIATIGTPSPTLYKCVKSVG